MRACQRGFTASRWRRPPERCACRQCVQDRNPRESEVRSATLRACAPSSRSACGNSPLVYALSAQKAMAMHAVRLRRARRRERTMLPVSNDTVCRAARAAPKRPVGGDTHSAFVSVLPDSLGEVTAQLTVLRVVFVDSVIRGAGAAVLDHWHDISH